MLRRQRQMPLPVSFPFKYVQLDIAKAPKIQHIEIVDCNCNIILRSRFYNPLLDSKAKQKQN